MEPLDLTSRAPRSPREQMLGLYFIPRTIDKMRGQLPGGNLGSYIVEGPDSMSAYLLYKLKIDAAEMRAAVARANDDTDVEEWLRPRIDPAVVDVLNAKLLGSRIDAAPPDKQELVRSKHPVLAGRPDLQNAFDMLEADDAWSFARH